MPLDNQLTPAQIEHRKAAFDKWLALNGGPLGYYRAPPSKQDNLRYMLRRAFYAGSNYEARMAALEEVENGTA